MFHAPLSPNIPLGRDVSSLLDQLSQCCSRPRYAYMLLTLIADVARPDGSAGPNVDVDGSLISLRDWLCDALTPMGRRDHRRAILIQRVQEDLRNAGALSGDAEQDEALIAAEVCVRIRASGKTNLSRSVSELVKAGLLQRHYQGYRVDHLNRGAQRQAVYTLAGRAKALIASSRSPSRASPKPKQGDLFAGG